jgi:hypothetical protein
MVDSIKPRLTSDVDLNEGDLLLEVMGVDTWLQSVELIGNAFGLS